MRKNMEVSEGFKDTEIGPLPKEWKVVQLGDVSNVLNGYAFKSDDYVENGILNFRVVNIRRNGQIDIKTDVKYLPKNFAEKYSKYLLKEGDILLVMVGATRGKLGYITKNVLPALMNQNMWRIIPHTNQVLKKHVYFFLNHSIEDFLRNYSESTRGFFKKDEFKNILMPVPPLSKQKKIAAVLSAVQEANEKTEAVIEASKELKKSLMKHLFTYGPVPVDEAENVPLKETEVGLMPEQWEVVRLGEVSEVKYGKANPKDSGNIPVVGSGGIYSTTSNSLINFPTIVIGRKGTAGKVWLLLEPCYPSDTTFYLKWKKDMDVSFLFNYMALNPLSGEHAKTTLPSLQKPDLENLLIPYPPLPVQQKVADILSVADQKIEAEENKKKALEELFKTLLDNLMTAKIRVNQLGVEA